MSQKELDAVFRTSSILPKGFYARPTALVARELIGKLIRRAGVILSITETEAYCWPGDSANHGYRGRTKRNEPMWGSPGTLYIYLCYGLHHMLNIVTEEEGVPTAVLIRACEPVFGLELIKKRRNGQTGSMLLAGPGKVAQALDITRSHSFQSITSPGDVEIWDTKAIPEILAGPRIGIGYAHPRDQRLCYRFADARSDAVAKRRLLRKMRSCALARDH